MNRPRTFRTTLLLLALLCVPALWLAGCNRNGLGSDFDIDHPPTYAELAAGHNTRADLLDTMYAFGAIEIRWTDDRGNHFEQGDLDVWLQMPDKVALQVGKAGERFFWLGGNSEASWFFDLRKKGQTFAELHGPSTEARGEGDVPIAVSMTSLLEMMGLSKIPEEKPEDAADVRFDKKQNAWVLSTVGSAGPMRIFIDARRNLPVRIELLDPHTRDAKSDRSTLLYSTLPLLRYEYIFMKGKAVDQFPLVPTLIDVFRADGTGSLKISVSKPVAEDESFNENYFDLDWLLAVLAPDEVRDTRPPSGGQP